MFAWLNTNKSSLATDDASAHRRADRRGRHIAGLRCEPAGLAGQHEALRKTNPALVICAISWFGESGPYRDFVATEVVCRGMAGGIHAIGPVEGPPVIPLDGQNGVIAGLAAFIATASGLYNRQPEGRRFSLSIQEALMHAMEMDFSSTLTNGHARRRPGVNLFGRHYPSSIYPTRDEAGSASAPSPPPNGAASAP